MKAKLNVGTVVNKKQKDTSIKYTTSLDRYRKLYTFKARKSLTRPSLLPDLYAGLAIFGAFMLELRHIVTSDWQNFFFSNSDMLTLPLLNQSVVAHEPFNWVFSSQIFLFPESIIYSLCAIFTPNFRVALMLNALVILLLTYGLLQWLGHYFVKNIATARLYALVMTLGLIGLTLLEPVSGNMAFATFYLNTTTYYGVILAALICIGLIFACVSAKRREITNPSRQKRLLLSLLVVSFLTSLSNPLFIFQFIIPVIVVTILGLLINVLRFRLMIQVLSPLLAGVVIAQAVRKTVLMNIFSPLGNVGSYLHFNQVGSTLRTLKITLISLLHGSGQEHLEIYVILLGVIMAFGAFLFTINQATRYHDDNLEHHAYQTNVFLVRGLAGLTPVLVLAGIILTGNPLTRYLLPVILFPILAIIPVLSSARIPHPRQLSYAFWGIGVVAILAGVLSHPVSSTKAVANYYTSDQQCLDRLLRNTPYRVGVAQYWRARGLQLNSRASLTLIQSEGGIARFTWLYNSADYYLYHPSFVVVDKIPAPYDDPQLSLEPAYAITANRTINLLGSPSEIGNCTSFSVYMYPKTNLGNAVLNNRLRDKNLGL